MNDSIMIVHALYTHKYRVKLKDTQKIIKYNNFVTDVDYLVELHWSGGGGDLTSGLSN